MINHPKSKGLTLVELCTTLAIASIVMVFAIPSFKTMIDDNRFEQNISLLRELIVFARVKAVESSQSVIACPWRAEAGCHSNWKHPIAVFVDQNRDLSPDDGSLLRQFQPLQYGSITPRPAGKRYFRFSPTGLVDGQTGSFVFCEARSDAPSGPVYLAINFGGRPRTERDIDHDGSIETAGGDTLSCSGV